ncbi:MAG TPA: HlyD family secretion protein [Coleofasciculaceae cyanobacterium]|jgi:membrane fusion protein (multidrug efflux system)
MNSINHNQSNGHLPKNLSEPTSPAEQRLKGKTTVLEPASAQATETAFPEKTVDERTEQDDPTAIGTTTPDSAASRRHFPKKLILAGALGLGAIAAGVTGYHWWQFASTHEQTDNATVSGHVYQISSRIPGTVMTVPVDDNQSVQAGQLLVQLDPQDYQVKVQQAQAAIAVAQRQAQAAQGNISLAGANTQAQTAEAQGNVSGALAAIATAQAAVNEAQSGIPAAQAQLVKAEADLQKVETDYNRYQALYQAGAVAKQQLDSAKAAYDVAVAQRDVAQQGVSQARSKVAQAEEGVTSAQAQLAASQGGLQKAQAGGVQTQVNKSQYEAANAEIAQAQASLAAAQLQLAYTRITAPAAGHIGHKTAEVGNSVQAGQPLMAIVGDELWVIANFKETQVSHMHPGDPVEVDLDAFPDHKFTGRVNSLSPASGSQFSLLPPDNATGNFTKVVQRIPVKVVLDAASVKGYESLISPGMSANVTVAVK